MAARGNCLRPVSKLSWTGRAVASGATIGPFGAIGNPSESVFETAMSLIKRAEAEGDIYA